MREMAIVIVVFVAILSGCVASTDQFKIKQSIIGSDTGIDLLVEPAASVGLVETSVIHKTVIQGVFPVELFAEYSAGRIRWNALGALPNGQQFFGQLFLSGIMPNGEPACVLVLDIDPSSIGKPRVVILSTEVDWMYDLAGNEYPLDRKLFIGDEKYRLEEILEKGTLVSDMAHVPDFLEHVNKVWNRYQTPYGVIRTPAGDEQMEELIKINPQYTFFEKLVANGRFTLVMDPWGILLAGTIDILRSSAAQDAGLGRKSAGTRNDFVAALKFQKWLYKNGYNQLLASLEKEAGL